LRAELKEEPVALSLSHRQDGGTLIICAVGDLDLSTATAFERDIATAVATDISGVVIDMSGVEFLDSAGINALLQGRRTADEHGRVFRVERTSGLVHEVLVMTGVWSHLSGDPS
jgi:anti-sigma B factor antagonist